MVPSKHVYVFIFLGNKIKMKAVKCIDIVIVIIIQGFEKDKKCFMR